MNDNKSTSKDREKSTPQTELADWLQETDGNVSEAYAVGMMVMAECRFGLPVETFNRVRSRGFDVYQVNKSIGKSEGVTVEFKPVDYLEERGLADR